MQEECEDLRNRVKNGVLKRPTVVRHSCLSQRKFSVFLPKKNKNLVSDI